MKKRWKGSACLLYLIIYLVLIIVLNWITNILREIWYNKGILFKNLGRYDEAL